MNVRGNHETDIAQILAVIERKARIHCMGDVLVELDRLADLCGPDQMEAAATRLAAILEIVRNKLQKAEQ